jgi:serine/threonine protein kinase
MVATSPPPPPQWPKECAQIYSPVRVIGRGGFAEVWMAKRKGSSSDSDGDTHVAVKVVGKDVYSRREVAILSELSQTPHPNIVRLLNDFKGEEDGGHHIVVMSLHRGPTLKHIIEKGGALGLKIAQTVSRQLTDAVAYLTPMP